MEIPVSKAKGMLTELVRRAETGQDVVLTRHGRAAVSLVPVRPQLDPDAKRAAIASICAAAAQKRIAGADAARSQDFLYGESGLPD